MDVLERKTYMGLDFSTQQLKGMIVDEDLHLLYEETVEFDRDLPEFRTTRGVYQTGEKLSTVTSPVIMWVKALDLLLDKLQVAGVDFGQLIAVSGCAQQHGTVYWQKGSQEILTKLDPSSFLHSQLAAAFSVADSPNWMDSSTTIYCKKLEEAVGSALELARITGSVAYERFSGSQIAKVADKKSSAYENTERISLVSSFASSLFLGNYADIDFSDGSGMNLMDIREKTWHVKCLDACGTNLAEKLGTPVPSDSVLGPISEYYVERFAFNPDCRVVSFTGDNPASLIGMRVERNDIAMSLGTSDTLFMWLEEPKLLPEGHIFVNPLNCDLYMALLCYKNGSLARERFRDLTPEKSWNQFNTYLEKTPRGNFGNLGLFYEYDEILPKIQGDFRFDKDDHPVTKFGSPEVEIRAAVEGQFVAKRAHVEDLGFDISLNKRIMVTGGGSKSKGILQVISDVFNSSVYVMSTNSAALGGAYLAKQATRDKECFKPEEYFSKITEKLGVPEPVCTPFSDADKIYTPMVKRYKKLIKNLLK